jgi:hypothetical protein
MGAGPPVKIVASPEATVAHHAFLDVGGMSLWGDVSREVVGGFSRRLNFLIPRVAKSAVVLGLYARRLFESHAVTAGTTNDIAGFAGYADCA